MTDRIHEVLDGERPTSELSPEEFRELERLSAASETAAHRLGQLQSPDLTGSVMRAIRTHPSNQESTADGRATGRSWVRSIWEPRTLSIRPAWGLVAAAVFAAVLLLPGGDPAPAHDGALSADGVTVFVQFRLHEPEASEVRLAGSFTGWEPLHRLHRSGDGMWSVMVPMDPGIHDYAFVVDGTEWTPDPAAPRVDDGFGGENSRLALLLTNGTGGS
jgi:hypothetical protein